MRRPRAQAAKMPQVRPNVVSAYVAPDRGRALDSAPLPLPLRRRSRTAAAGRGAAPGSARQGHPLC